ncbi:molybdopterin-dependent oxidoreductase [Streptomyces cyaneofuscatus]
MGSDHLAPPPPRPRAPRQLPPGQQGVAGRPVSHYGPVPLFRPERWDLKIFGATAEDVTHSWSWDEITALPRTTVVADLHCAQGTTSTDHEWFGIPAATLLRLAPPAAGVTHVMAWAEYGYSANLRLSDFTAPTTLLATHRPASRPMPTAVT